jgi:hypothetical protein
VLRASGRPTQFLCEPYRFPPANRHPNFGCPEEDCICGCHLRSAVTSTNSGRFMHFRDWAIKLAPECIACAEPLAGGIWMIPAPRQLCNFDNCVRHQKNAGNQKRFWHQKSAGTLAEKGLERVSGTMQRGLCAYSTSRPLQNALSSAPDVAGSSYPCLSRRRQPRSPVVTSQS